MIRRLLRSSYKWFIFWWIFYFLLLLIYTLVHVLADRLSADRSLVAKVESLGGRIVMDDVVDLRGCPITDGNLRELVPLLQGHRFIGLDLSNTNITDQGLRDLEPLSSSIGRLSLSRTHITNDSLGIISSSFSNIVMLDLSYTQIDWHGLSLLKLSRLNDLTLGKIVSDKELDALSNLPNLGYLSVPSQAKMNMSVEAANRLQQRHPSLVLMYYGE